MFINDQIEAVDFMSETIDGDFFSSYIEWKYSDHLRKHPWIYYSDNYFDIFKIYCGC